MDWIKDHIITIVGTLAVIGGGMYIPFVRNLVFTGVKTIVSEAVLKKVAIQVVEKLVKSSKNKLDDIWFAEFRKNVEKS